MLARCTRRASKNRCTVIRAYSTRRDSTFASPALWRPRREDTLRVQQEAFTRESKPVYQNKRGSEHVFNSDIHFPHILHEDEQLGLAFIGVHPLTRKLDIRRFIAKIATVRHCWLFSESTVLARFESAEGASLVRTRFEELNRYPFDIYSDERGNWAAPAPPDWPAVCVEPLTLKYQSLPFEPSRVVILRAELKFATPVMALIRKYRTKDESPQLRSCTWTAHDTDVAEWHIRFPTVELARRAVLDLHGKNVVLPVHGMSSKQRIEAPGGLSCYLWLQYTGSDDWAPKDQPLVQLTLIE